MPWIIRTNDNVTTTQTKRGQYLNVFSSIFLVLYRFVYSFERQSSREQVENERQRKRALPFPFSTSKGLKSQVCARPKLEGRNPSWSHTFKAPSQRFGLPSVANSGELSGNRIGRRSTRAHKTMPAVCVQNLFLAACNCLEHCNRRRSTAVVEDQRSAGWKLHIPSASEMIL